jgi:hypothetical protein
VSGPLLDLPAVAAHLGLTVKGVRGLVARGELPAYRIASRIRVDPADLRAYMGISDPVPTPPEPEPIRTDSRPQLPSLAQEYADVLRRDPCSYCGRACAGAVDHVDALFVGGEHDWPNLTAACRSCNSSKARGRLLAWLLRGAPTP